MEVSRVLPLSRRENSRRERCLRRYSHWRVPSRSDPVRRRCAVARARELVSRSGAGTLMRRREEKRGEEGKREEKERRRKREEREEGRRRKRGGKAERREREKRKRRRSKERRERREKLVFLSHVRLSLSLCRTVTEVRSSTSPNRSQTSSRSLAQFPQYEA